MKQSSILDQRGKVEWVEKVELELGTIHQIHLWDSMVLEISMVLGTMVLGTMDQ
jgi:hypothetical protein